MLTRKQYFLHSAVVEPEENKYVYRLNQDHAFVFEVLENIFQRWDIKNNTVIIKIDNAPTLQYKNNMLSNQCLIDATNTMFGSLEFLRLLVRKKGHLIQCPVLASNFFKKGHRYSWFQNSSDTLNIFNLGVTVK